MRRLQHVAAGFLLSLLTLSALGSAAGAAPTAHGAPLPTHPLGTHRAHPHPPALGFPGGHRALLAGEFYTQQGMTIDELNGHNTAGVSTLIEDIPVVSSPYPIAYELNGLSDTGDWYQITVDDNWPGCPGFGELTEIWNNAQGSGPVNCYYPTSFSAGAVAQLELNFTSSGNVCLDFSIVPSITKSITCTTQPDTGGKSWVFLSTIADSNGYYTGPMTEIINLTASSCPDYTTMPRLNYLYPPGFWVTSETPWSDEFDLAGSGICYSSSNGLDTFSAGDPTTHFADTASGTSYGPHWSGGQNISMVNASFGWRYATDPVPINSVSASASQTLAATGQTVDLNVSLAGGTKPYHALWKNDTAWLGVHPATWAWLVPYPGVFNFTAYGIDAAQSVFGPSNTIQVNVPGPLTVGAVVANGGRGGADVGQRILITVPIHGGYAPYAVSWSGLPTGCAAANSSRLVCAPTTAGPYSIGVSVKDANRTTLSATPASFVVVPDTNASLSVPRLLYDEGQSIYLAAHANGGGGGYTYGWQNLPTGCSAGTLVVSLVCIPNATGSFAVTTAVTDAYAFVVTTKAVNLSVQTDPQVSVHVVRAVNEIGETLSATAAVVGGTVPYKVSWGGVPAGCPPSTTLHLDCALSTSGNFSLNATVEDGALFNVTSPAVPLQVNPLLVVSLKASPSMFAVGGTTVVSLSVAGGTPKLAASWTGVPSFCTVSPSGYSASCAPTDPGTYSITVRVTDAIGTVKVANVNFTELTPTQSNTSPTSIPTGTWLLLLIPVVVVIAAVGLVARRRRRPPVEYADSGTTEP
ncbi:MAG TPA: hypothetical protein VFF67_10035 [Thermoplasmata archaeon]|nr:hypothetical protein [Thermoplasmata archaeon]